MSPLRNEAVKTLVNHSLDDLLNQVRPDQTGELAGYIPQLCEVDPEGLALSVVSSTGHIYEAGDVDRAFTIQSISKPFVYAMTLAEFGAEEVHKYVGVKPIGEPFNAISLDDDGRPANPMINAGAIVTSALVMGDSPEDRFERIRSTLSAFAGRELDVDEQVFQSEAETGHRNRALANLALAAGTLVRGVREATDVYFRQCSIRVTSTDLAVMGATLANNGVNPITRVQVVGPEEVRRTLAVMLSCGMYNYSGYWLNDVGLPAKSGVGGGIVAVAPGQFGVGTYSPRLDPTGSSVRGVTALRLMSEQLGLHILNHPNRAESFIRNVDSSVEALFLKMHGDLDFATFERIIHEVGQRSHTLRHVHIDLEDSVPSKPSAQGLLKKLKNILDTNDIPTTVNDPKDIFDED